MENWGNLVQFGGLGEGFDDEVVGVGSWVAVVDGEGIDESGEEVG